MVFGAVIACLGVVAAAPSVVIAEEDFEGEPLGTLPAGWAVSGRMEGAGVRAGSDGRHLRLAGTPGGCLTVMAHYEIPLPAEGAASILARIRPTIEQEEGCHVGLAGGVSLFAAADWRAPRRDLATFGVAGRVDSHGERAYEVGRWQNLRIDYERDATRVRVVTYLDGELVGEHRGAPLVGEESLRFLTFTPYDHVAEVDDVRVRVLAEPAPADDGPATRSGLRPTWEGRAAMNLSVGETFDFTLRLENPTSAPIAGEAHLVVDDRPGRRVPFAVPAGGTHLLHLPYEADAAGARRVGAFVEGVTVGWTAVSVTGGAGETRAARLTDGPVDVRFSLISLPSIEVTLLGIAMLGGTVVAWRRKKTRGKQGGRKGRGGRSP